MKKLILLPGLFISLLSVGQQDLIFSQYMFNPLTINPAYAGSRNAYSLIIGTRNQWVNIDGAPVTNTLNLHGPIGKRVGAGLQIFAEEIGPKSSLTYLATYAYRLPLGNGNLGLGLRAGGITYSFRWNEINYKDKADVFNLGTETQQTAFNADFGLFYYTKKFYAGLSGNHIASNLALTEISNSGAEQYLKTHIFLSSGLTIETSKLIAIQPGFLLRVVENAPLNADINLNLLFDKRLTLGVSMRTSRTWVALIQMHITPAFRLGYSYDNGRNLIGQLGGGGHELFLGLDLKTKRTKTVHPRYF